MVKRAPSVRLSHFPANTTMISLGAIAILTIAHICDGEGLRGPPQFEKNPQYSSSYLPAGMQVIAYLTELMKYELRPGSSDNQATSTTTHRPTSSHRPGLYAPEVPGGPQAFFAAKNEYQEYVERIRNPEAYRAATKFWLENLDSLFRQKDQNSQDIDDLQLLGRGTNELYKLVNALDGDENEDEDARIIRFTDGYDDTEFQRLVLQKKTPPTRAYVTLLSLYDLLNKEAKKLGLNKFNGYTEGIVKDLADTSSGTSAYQLEYILNMIVTRRDITDQTAINKIKTLLGELGKDESYINIALRYLPALPFVY